MANFGSFDPDIYQKASFDPTLQPEGWFDKDLIPAGAAAASFARDIFAKYSVLTSHSFDISARYYIRSVITLDTISRYQVETGFSYSIEAKYLILTTTSQSIGAEYDVLPALATRILDKQGSYMILQNKGVLKGVEYMISRLGIIQVPTMYQVIRSIEQDLPSEYSVVVPSTSRPRSRGGAHFYKYPAGEPLTITFNTTKWIPSNTKRAEELQRRVHEEEEAVVAFIAAVIAFDLS